MKTRRVISLTLALSFVAMAYTGVMLFLTPQGRIAHWTGWRLLGLSKDEYGALHTNFMLVFLVTGVWHIVLNWRPFVKYLKDKAKKLRVFTPEFNVALVLCVVFAAGTLAGLPPFSTFVGLGDSMKDYWERAEGSPPWGHAEENTLARFSRKLVDWERHEHDRRVTLTAEDALEALRGAGLDVESDDQVLLDIAEANDTTPQAIMEIVRRAEQPTEEGEEPPEAPPAQRGPFPMPTSGLGRMTLESYCERYDVDLDRARALLAEEGAVDASRPVRELASVRGTDPEGLIELLNTRAEAAAQ